jgi:hypothetical protein
MDSKPVWAYNWCYFFAVIGVASLITGIASLSLYKKMGTVLIIASVIAALIQAATAFTLFYMCRSSLQPNISY